MTSDRKTLREALALGVGSSDGVGFECRLCNASLGIDFGNEPTTLCNDCAQTLVEEHGLELLEQDARVNSAETDDFLKALPLEAAHQVERFGSEHDAGKTPADFYWVLGHLAGKAVHSLAAGDITKAKHHIITSAALLLNWHKRVSGEQAGVRPGIEGPRV